MISVVIIAEKRILPKNVDLFSNELDFSSEGVTNRILKAFEVQGVPTYYYDSPKDFLDNISNHQNDIVLSALWGGRHSRNKRSLIAAICEAYQICYVGADAFVQALCQDKYLSKAYLRDFSFSVPEAILITSPSDLEKLNHFSKYPCIIKPNDEGSSVGISESSIAYDKGGARELAQNLLSHYSPVLVEQFIPGKEVSVCCASSYSEQNILEAVQLVINGEQEINRPWGFEAKKAGQAIVTRNVITEHFPKDILTECQRLFLSLGKVDLMRIDGKLYQDRFYIIELSPDCSLHETCFMSTAFAHNNFTYEKMLSYLAKAAWERFSITSL